MSNQFKAELEEIYTGAQAGIVNRWNAVDFFDKVLFAQSTIQPLYWPGGGRARPIPGLDKTTYWDGIEVVNGYIVLWRGDTIKWSDLNDFTGWIPVAETAVSMTAPTTSVFHHPDVGQTSEWIHLNNSAQMFVVGQYVRAELNIDDPTTAIFNFYEVAEISSPAGVIADSINVTQSFTAGITKRLFLATASDFAEGSRVIVEGSPKTLQVTDVARDVSAVWTSAAQSAAVPDPDGRFTIQVTENPSALRVGDVLSLGNIAATGLDLYEITAVGFTLELKRLNIGTRKQALNYRFPAGTYLTFQPFIEVENYGTSTITVVGSSEITVNGAVKVKGLALTGESTPGDAIPIGTYFFSVDANEAGEAINAGSQINGDVFAIVSLGEFGVILKERSIQTMQSVGRASGTFFLRAEILDEGPISKNAWRRVGDKKIVFLGHKNLYAYAGGQTITPIATRHMEQVFEELDRARADEVILHHKEASEELWLVYPAIDSDVLKVMVYNYREDSVTIDEYSNTLGGITAVGELDWEIGPTWESLSETQYWEDETLKWYEYVEEGEQRYTLIAVGADSPDLGLGELAGTDVPRLLLHGRKFSRASGDNCTPGAYTSLAETADFDFGDSAKWKYCDTVQLNLEVKEHKTRPMKLYVQLGARDNLDSDIRWSSPASVDVSGNGSVTTKVNVRMAGRFLRVRFYSNAVDAEWRISGFRLMARLGGTY